MFASTVPPFCVFFVLFPQTVVHRVYDGASSSSSSSSFFFFYESVYIIYILLFKIFWHSDFHFMVASGSCAC